MSKNEIIKEIQQNFHNSVVKLLENPVELAKSLEKYHRNWSESRNGSEFSFYNFMVLQSQYPIDYCCALSVWNEKYNRKVKKGSKSLRILAPMKIKTKQVDENEDPVYITRFKAVPVFDVSQTEARDETSTLPVFDEPTVKSSKKLNIRGLIKKIKAFFNITVEYETTINRKGISFQKKNLIKVREGLIDEETFNVIMHELAHQLMHKEAKKGKKQKEYEAETVSYILCSLNNLESPESEVYVASWTQKQETLKNFAKKSANDIINTVSTIQSKLF